MDLTRQSTATSGIEVLADNEPGPQVITEPGIVDIADRVLLIATNDPGRPALIHAHHRPGLGPRYDTYTYGELSEAAESLAAGLQRIGVSEGTLVSFMVPPCFESLVIGVALWRIGAVTVGIEPHSHGLRRVAKCLAKVGPEVFIGTARAHAARVGFGWGRTTVRTNIVVAKVAPPGMHTIDSLMGEAVNEPQRSQARPEDPTVIAFTTGSTGDPKPTVIRQRNFADLIAKVKDQWGFDEGDPVVDMPTFPMFWIIGLSTGGTVVVPPMDFTVHGPGDADPARLLRTIRDCGVKSMFASPALLTNLSRYAIDNNITIPGLRRIVAGGAEIQGPLFKQVKSVLEDGAEMYSDYGATEALPVAEISGTTVLNETWADTVVGAGLCAGTPLKGVEVKIIAASDAVLQSLDDTVELATGRVGEILVRSNHISEDYYLDPTATAANKIPDGQLSWHRIGDLGYLDGQGRLWLCGRKSHAVAGEDGPLYPLCVEPVFNAHPEVARSALVGVTYGDRVVPTLCVERFGQSSVTAADLESDLLRIASDHSATRRIERVVFMSRLPVDQRHNAKIDRPGIAAALGAAWALNGATSSVELRSRSVVSEMLK